MMQSIKREIEIPEGVKVDVKDGKVIVEGAKGKIEKMFFHPKISIEKEDNKISLKCDYPKAKEKAIIGSYEAHIRNMIKGVTEGFIYKMKIVYSHFPIKVSVKGNEVIIENFLGEKFPRKTKIFGNVKVSVKGDEITLEGINIEEVGQTAANIESTTRIKDKDIRVFQDGIYIIKKG
ncbi:MAG: 50S ribosomal protein L6 [Thermoplasmatales archaeon]|nr:50S ribosomal protein L6 [Thermoplasmatales archaeon]